MDAAEFFRKFLGQLVRSILRSSITMLAPGRIRQITQTRDQGVRFRARTVAS